MLYDANLPEIRAIVPAPDGAIYVAALGGSVARATSERRNRATGASTPHGDRAGDEHHGDRCAGRAGPAPKPEAPKTVVTDAVAVVTTAATSDYTGVEKSALYKINPDKPWKRCGAPRKKTFTTWWFRTATLLFVTDAQGRIYRLDRDRKPTLVAQTNEGEATRLLESRARLARRDRKSRESILRLEHRSRSPADGSNRRCTIPEPSRAGDA